MFVRKYKEELIPNLKEWEKKILSHWKGHGKPYWTDPWEQRTTRETRHDFEVIVAITWITQGARGCRCFNNSPVLQDYVANYFLTRGSIEACDIIINNEIQDKDFDPNLPLVKPRKLLL